MSDEDAAFLVYRVLDKALVFYGNGTVSKAPEDHGNSKDGKNSKDGREHTQNKDSNRNGNVLFYISSNGFCSSSFRIFCDNYRTFCIPPEIF